MCDEAWNLRNSNTLIPHVISDEKAIAAVDQFQSEFDKRVEPACGAALDVMYSNEFENYTNVMIIVCGGITW